MKIELRILLTFYQKDLYYLFFGYIYWTVVPLDVQINFVKLLKNTNFLQISGIDVNTNFYNNIKGIFKDLQAESRNDRVDSRLLGSIEFIVEGEEFIENRKFVSVHHFYFLYSIFLLIVYYFYFLYNIRSFNNSIHHINKQYKEIGSY